MRTEREWRESLGAYVLGQLSAEERAAVGAHLEGCPGCRAERESLAPVAEMMPLADPDLFAAAPLPPPELRDRVTAAIERERRSATRRRRRRVGLVFGSAAAAATTAALTVALLLSAGPGTRAPERISFAQLPSGAKITATLQPRAYGTEIQMYVKGIPDGTLCRVALRGDHGVQASAGTFRYRRGDEQEATLSAGLALAGARAIVVHAGSQVFVAPLAAHSAHR